MSAAEIAAVLLTAYSALLSFIGKGALRKIEDQEKAIADLRTRVAVLESGEIVRKVGELEHTLQELRTEFAEIRGALKGILEFVAEERARRSRRESASGS